MDNIVVRTDLAVEANEEAMNGTGNFVQGQMAKRKATGKQDTGD